MRKLWQDIKAHKLAAVLFLVYWIATLVVVPITWDGGIPFPVVLLLFTLPLIAGILVGLWRPSTPEHTVRLGDKTGDCMMAGLLCTVITFLVMKGGAIDEVIGWMRGWEFYGQWGEMVVFFIVSCALGVVLGFAGALLASSIENLRNRLTSGSS